MKTRIADEILNALRDLRDALQGKSNMKFRQTVWAKCEKCGVMLPVARLHGGWCIGCCNEENPISLG